jgi:soluble lytic murein transglycosylase-like protein
MAVRAQLGCGILLALLALGASPARGQITPVVDANGKRIFVNAEDPAPRRSSRPASKAGLAAARTTQSPANASGNSGASRLSKELLERLVRETAERHRVDPALVKAVIEAESGWNPSAVSRKGAIGLMQLIPGTAQRYGVDDAFNPEQNLDGGVKYLRTLLERYNGDLHMSLAAYNAGEHAVDRARGVPRYRETQNYVQKVTETYFRTDSGRQSSWFESSRPIYRATDERGRVIYTNE